MPRLSFRKKVIRTIVIVGLLAGALTLMGAGWTSAEDAPRCKVVGSKLIAFEYEPATGVARVVYTHSVGGVVYAEGYAVANHAMTPNQAKHEALRQALESVCQQLSKRILQKLLAAEK